MVVFDRLTHLFYAIEASLSATLFNSPSFQSLTIFILEVSSQPFIVDTNTNNNNDNNNHLYQPNVQVVNLDLPIDDPEREIFRSSGGLDMVLAGFVFFFPNYPTFLGKLGF